MTTSDSPKIEPMPPANKAEETLLREVKTGRVAKISNRLSGFLPYCWSEGDVIRADFLRHVCLHPDLYEVDPRGINIRGALIQSVLDLSFCEVKHPLGFAGCRFDAQLNFTLARTRSMAAIHCVLPGLNAQGLNVAGNLKLADSAVRGETRLAGADIKGQLDCTGVTFTNEGGYALNADRLRVGGSVSLVGIKATGETRLLGADIKGQLGCQGATFANEGGYAFNIDGLTVGGSVSLAGVTVMGETRPLGADIKGQLDCKKATFANEGGEAFVADGLKVGSGVSLAGVIVTGEMRLLSADIQGQLDCTGATFKNQGGKAFNAQGLKVAGVLFWQPQSRTVGWVDFTSARVSVLVDDESGWPHGLTVLDGFEYKRFGPNATAETCIGWLKRMPDQDEDGAPIFFPQPYEQVIKVFKDSGHEHEARKVAIAKQDVYRAYLLRVQAHGKRNTLPRRVWMWFFKITAGYGYEPWRAVIGSLFIVLIGWMIFSVTYNNGYMAPSKERVFMHACYVGAEKNCTGWKPYDLRFNKNKKLVIPADYPEFNSFVYAVDTFIPILDLHQEDYWSPTSTTWFGDGFARFWLWTYIVAGWVLTTIAVTGFAGVLKKD